MIINSRIENKMMMVENVKAGFYGEEKTTRYLSEAQFAYQTLLFRNVVLDGAQMDIILVNPKFICILEVKNITGDLYFDEKTKQFYRITDGIKQGMRNPELQLLRNVKVLHRRLENLGLDLDVYGFIIFASRKGIVMEPPTLFPALPIDAMCDFLERIEESSTTFLKDEYIEKVTKIIDSGEPSIHDEELLERLNLIRSEIIGGVRCQQCFNIGMIRMYSTWRCEKCGFNDRHAHLPAIQEYQLIFGREMTVKDVKWWLRIEDKHLVSRLLFTSSEGCRCRKNRKYRMKLDLTQLDKFLAFEMQKR